jgi:ankyrin repeat protein
VGFSLDHLALLFSVARLLIRNGADVDRANEAGRTPLHYACMNGHVPTVQLLMKSGTRAASNKCCTSLCSGCQKRYLSGADANRTDNEIYTPFHYACQNGHRSVVKVLLANETTL